MPVREFPDEITIWICGLGKVDFPLQCGWASSKLLAEFVFLPNKITYLFLNVNHRPHATRDVLEIRWEALPTVCEVHPALGWLPRRRWSPLCSLPANSCHITCSREQEESNMFPPLTIKKKLPNCNQCDKATYQWLSLFYLFMTLVTCENTWCFMQSSILF